MKLQAVSTATSAGQSQKLKDADSFLLAELQRRMTGTENIWSLPDRDRYDSGHAFFQYPAMMVPAVQRTLIEIVKTSQPEVGNLIDPYVGAGTTLTAGMHNGLDAFGQDVNPLAVLVAKVRSGPFYIEALEKHTQFVVETASTDKPTRIANEFPNRRKWFSDEVAFELASLTAAIRRVNPIWARRFMWVTLAETVRLTSNDRTTTYKLHARPEYELKGRLESPLVVFSQLIHRNLRDLMDYKVGLAEKGYVNKGRYRGKVIVSFGDTTSDLNDLLNRGVNYFDLLITSPPYGDNKSTITYGQHSYLPLQWIDLHDIDPKVDNTCLDTTYSIDSNSIGGRRSRDLETQVDGLRQLSLSLAGTFDSLQDKPRDRTSRVAAFYDDFAKSLKNVVALLNKNAYLVFTVGNRSVGGIEIPNDRILCELLEGQGVPLIAQLERRIHNKRMPHRNHITGMMRTEKILIFRKTTEVGEVS